MVGFAPKTARNTNGEYEAVNEKDKGDFAYLLGQRYAPFPFPLDVEGRGMSPLEHIRSKLARKHVTLRLLWHEYRQKNPGRLRVRPVLPALPSKSPHI